MSGNFGCISVAGVWGTTVEVSRDTDVITEGVDVRLTCIIVGLQENELFSWYKEADPSDIMYSSNMALEKEINEDRFKISYAEDPDDSDRMSYFLDILGKLDFVLQFFTSISHIMLWHCLSVCLSVCLC